mmetsp:Transcript_26108/g.57150  ORF Transcript_26108/g.57150 Transcript_26108/m.57150 type:complete len:202 (+) Transcript_26108:1371-1976(+)
MHQARKHLEDRIHVFLAEAHNPQGIAKPLEVLLISFLELNVPSPLVFCLVLCDFAGFRVAAQDDVLLLTTELPLGEFLFSKSAQHLIEAVVAPLQVAVRHHPGTFQQIRRHPSINQCARLVKEDAIVLAKARGIVVPHGHGIAKGLQDGLCLQDPLLDLRGDAAAGARHKAQVLHHNLGGLSFSCTALTRDDEGLVLMLAH